MRPETEPEDLLMPLDYHVDHALRLVHATARGRLTDQDVFGYQLEVWGRPEVAGFDELVDMSAVEHIDIPSSERMKELVRLSAGADPPNQPSKFAIVAPDRLSYDLAQFFKVYRELDPRSTKTITVFRSLGAALDWLGIEHASS
jgi:hypothetical protein